MTATADQRPDEIKTRSRGTAEFAQAKHHAALILIGHANASGQYQDDQSADYGEHRMRGDKIQDGHELLRAARAFGAGEDCATICASALSRYRPKINFYTATARSEDRIRTKKELRSAGATTGADRSGEAAAGLAADIGLTQGARVV